MSYVLLIVGRIFLECPVSEDFHNYILQDVLCLQICD